MPNQNDQQNKTYTLREKIAAGVVIASTSAFALAEGAEGAVTVDASAITSLMTPIATVGGAVLTVLIAIRGWKLMRRAL